LPVAVLFAVAGLGYILAAKTKRTRLKWLTKPFAIPFLCLTYLLASRNPNPWIVAGLLCGAAGDVLLIPNRKTFFLAGLVAFLLGHVAYLVAFLEPVVQEGLAAPLLLLVAAPLAVFGILLYRALRSGLGRMKLPLGIYMGVILCMALASVLRAGFGEDLLFWLPVLGAVMFLVSDAILACREFGRPIPHGSVLVAITYLAAQALIAVGFLFGNGVA
jgi:uncharacterized membrane protein YhhN